MYGGRTSLLIGLVAALITTILAVVLGLLAGFYKGWVDATISRAMDIVWSFPVVLLGREFWRPLLEFMSTRLIAERTIDPADLGRILVTDSPDEAAQAITAAALKHFGLKYGAPVKRSWLLGE